MFQPNPNIIYTHWNVLSKSNGVVPRVANSNLELKQFVWAYLVLLIFEGGLRKWGLPSLAAPLLIVRDPVALWIIFTAIRKDLLPKSFLLTAMTFISGISILTALFLGHGNLKIALYGARPFLIHFPLIFIIGKNLNRHDVLQIGKFILLLTMPMTILIALQFSSPQTAWVNRGIGGVIEEYGFQGANGHFRPSATFSFITGTYLFYGLAAAYIFYFLFHPKLISKLLLIFSTVSLLIAIPLSISRTLLFEVCITLLFIIISGSVNTRYFGKMIFILALGVFVLVLLGNLSFFQQATDTFFSRFNNANTQEGGVEGTLGDRFLGGLVAAISNSDRLPFFGYGIGMGTNVGSEILTGGRIFLLHEDEWGRIIDEQGPLLGQAVVLIRVAVAVRLAKSSWNKLLQADLLPWMLLSFGFLAIAQGNWSQPTSLGFCILSGGLIIAAFNNKGN